MSEIILYKEPGRLARVSFEGICVSCTNLVFVHCKRHLLLFVYASRVFHITFFNYAYDTPITC